MPERLGKGDRIDLDRPPRHCGYRMDAIRTGSGWELHCVEEDLEIHTDRNGILVRSPLHMS